MFKWFTLAQSSALSYCPVSLFQTSSVSLKDNWIYFRFWHFILAPISRVLARFIPCSWSSSCFCTFLCTTQWLHQFKCHQCQHTNSPLVLNVGLSQIFERIQLLVVYAAWLWIALPSCFVFFLGITYTSNLSNIFLGSSSSPASQLNVLYTSRPCFPVQIPYYPTLSFLSALHNGTLKTKYTCCLNRRNLMLVSGSMEGCSNEIDMTIELADCSPTRWRSFLQTGVAWSSFWHHVMY